MRRRSDSTFSRGSAILEGAIVLPFLAALVLAGSGLVEHAALIQALREVVQHGITASRGEIASRRLDAQGVLGIQIDAVLVRDGLERVVGLIQSDVEGKVRGGSYLIEAAYFIVPIDPVSGARAPGGPEIWRLSRGSLVIPPTEAARSDLEDAFSRYAQSRDGRAAFFAVQEPLCNVGQRGCFRPYAVLLGVRVVVPLPSGPLGWTADVLDLGTTVSVVVLSVLRGETKR